MTTARPLGIISADLSSKMRVWLRPQTLADRRHRQIALATLSSIAAKISGLLLAYASVSLAIGKLGSAAFGLWMTINSMSVLMPFADLGLGNGLISYVSRRIGESKISDIPGAVSACLYIAAASGAIMAGGGALITAHLSILSRIFGTNDPAALNEVIPSVTIFFLCLGMTLPLSIVEKVQMGAQDSYISNLWQICTTVLTLGGLYWISRGKCELHNLVLAYTGAPVIAKLANFIIYFFSTRRDLRPALLTPDWKTGRYLLRCGTAFVVLQSSVALGYMCDSLILASQLGAGAVAVYNVVQRLFSLTIIAELSIAPLWGAFGEALARGDVRWVRNTFSKSLRLNTALAASICLTLLLLGNFLIKHWTKSTVHAEPLLLASFALWRVFNVVQANLSVLLNHEKTLRKQTRFFLFAAILAFALKFPLLHVLGTSGVVLATVASFSILYAIPCFAMARDLLKLTPEDAHTVTA